MEFTISNSAAYKGYRIRIEPDKELLSIQDANGNFLKSATWEEMTSILLESRKGTRRKHIRTSMAVKIKYQNPAGTWKESITGTLGTGGLFIETPAPLDRGSDVQLELLLPDTPPKVVKTKGKVVWTRSQFEKVLHFPGMGIEFSDLPDPERASIEKLIRTINRSRGIE